MRYIVVCDQKMNSSNINYHVTVDFQIKVLTFIDIKLCEIIFRQFHALEIFCILDTVV